MLPGCRYYTTGNLTEKSDVYAFGVVLMDSLTGRPLTDKEGVFLGMRWHEALESGQVEFLTDPKIPGTRIAHKFPSHDAAWFWCMKKRGYDRPSMSQVVQEVKETGVMLMGPLKSQGEYACIRSVPEMSQE